MSLRRRRRWTAIILVALLFPFSFLLTSTFTLMRLRLNSLEGNGPVAKNESMNSFAAGIQSLSYFSKETMKNDSLRPASTFFARSGSTMPGPQHAIFYNIFIDPNNATPGIQIIEEQTMQIFHKLSSQGRTQHVPLYYNMIGHNYSGHFCPPNLTCIFLNYYEKAFEEVTLQNLYEYCVQNPLDEVYYLHNKGSFSTVSYNHINRIKHTNALFHNKGRRLLGNRHLNCNVVSMGWEPLPHWHNRGNFWLAKCSYVRELIPPKDFGLARFNMFRQLLQPSSRSSWECLRSYFSETTDDIYQQTDEVQYNVGVGRYNNELWIASHPHVIPCDATVFRTNISYKALFHQPYAEHEWFRMHGRLFEFYQLYGKIPTNSSFFWEYYAPAKAPVTPPQCRSGWDRTSYFQLTST